ncbi:MULTISPECIES: heme ABC transporter permease [Gammaproteobacteria]|uniref:heme ABC transporter permease n=1 Tax=Gammaproteobacteria TaxID=1236 RepID=UPI000DD06F4E|nr:MULTISPECIES: heme ABC transporter permease [Gammaproteobacteria]RTE86116.1 heme ABC transporter permease [Aliidiomarina sp. B3213]TCZ91469.1 heme ABC transporter permease [Lysobacter sp. N42]
MWRWLHPYAKPEATFRLNQKLLPWFAVPGIIVLAVGIIWGLAFAPADYQQGDSYRIIFTHVPAAMWSMGFYVGMAIAALIAIVWQIRTAEWAILAIAPVGAVLTFISLFTGAVWGKPMWGTWWEWDARLTSQLILFFLYLGVLALYAAFEDERTGAKAAGILALIGVVNIPIIHYSVYWWNTLHQQSTITQAITRLERPSIADEMLWPLLTCILGFLLVSSALVIMRLNNEILKREIRRPWAQQELTGHTAEGGQS